MSIKWFISVAFVATLVACSDKESGQHNESEASGSHLISGRDSTHLSVTVVASNLDVPWEIVWGPDNWIWYTEQSGSISKVNPETGERKLILRILPQVYRWGTRGLLCMALHPDFENQPYVVVNYHYMRDRYVKDIWSRWVRYTYDGETLKDPLILFEETAEAGHNGSRVTFAPDGKIIIANGDGDNKNDELNSGVAQNMEMFGGKVLRFNLDGSIPDDNPFPGSPVWALGFRVPQGLVFGPHGNLYSAEHGNNNDDEINLVRKGYNYGYPNVAGICDQPRELDFCKKNKVEPPIKAWTPTIAPSGMDYYPHNAIPEWNNALLVATLKTQSLRVLTLNEAGDQVVKERVYFTEMFGRIRDICVSPEGDVYISTSNRDWNPVAGYPKEKDDRILKISARKGKDVIPVFGENALSSVSAGNQNREESPGSIVYKNYCASCHKDDGGGVPKTFPALNTSARVHGEKDELIRVLLQGLNDGRYEAGMPAFTFLSDDQIADVTAYVHQTFAKKNTRVTPDDVAKIRAALR